MSTTSSRDEQVDERPACPVANQCRDKSFRRVSKRTVDGFFAPCQNDECFADGEPEDDEDVVVAHGRGTNHYHTPRDADQRGYD